MIRPVFRRARAWLVPLLGAVFLASCGGGGGDSGGGGSSDLRITLDRSSIAFDFAEGAGSAPAQVVATAVGTLPNPLYVLATDEGGALDPFIPAALTANSATFTISPRANLAAGTHTGRLLLAACSDAACNNRVGGTPLPVAYTITVRPVFKVTPNSVRLAVVSGEIASTSLAVQLPQGATSFSLLGITPPWLTVTPTASGFDLVTKPWRSGSFSVVLDIAAGNERRFVPVSYDVTPPPGGENDLVVTPAGLTFATTENAATATQSVTVKRPSWAPGTAVPWRVEYAAGGSGWLQVTETPTGLVVAASAAALRQGNYQATILFEPAQPGTPASVPVALTVGPGLVAPAAVAFTADAETTAPALRGQWTVQAVAGPAFTWRATSNQPWLKLSAASGSTGSVLGYSVDTAALGALDNFVDHTATVTLQPDPAHITPVSVAVKLAKRLPEVLAVGPQLLVTGRATTTYVSGRGFGAVGSPAARLQVAGLVPDAVTRVDDRTLKLQLTPQLPGTAAVSVGNALGLAPATATLRVISPQAFAYAAVPSGGNPRTIVLDPARASVYGVNVGTEALQRFRLQNGNWVVDAKPVAQVIDAGLSADGESVIVISKTGRLQLVDPATLATSFTLDHVTGFVGNLTYVGFGIPTTYDGRSWLPTGTGSWNELGYFDLRSRTVRTRPEQPGFTSMFYDGPWMATSRDGSRMLVVQSAGITPAPPMLGYSPQGGLFAPEASGQTFSYDIHLSADGSRAIFDGYEVRAGDGSLIGRASLAAFPGYFGLVGLMAPEGHRAYVLAMHETATVKPRVFVFDTRTANPVSANLTLVGQFDLQHDPTCRTGEYGCNMRARAAISPDGQTLFFLGDQHLVVQPVDAALRALGAPAKDLRPLATKPLRWGAGAAR